MGAPTKYTKEIANKICEEISNSTLGLRKICENNNIDYATMKRWLVSNDEFRAQYARAKESQADEMAEEILEIADETSNDTIHTDKGDIPNNEWIARSRLRVDSRKWIMSKLLPKKYGEKIDVTTDGDKINAPQTFITLSNGTKIPL